MHFVNQLRSETELIVSAYYKKRNSIVLLVQCVVMTRTAVGERGDLGLWECVVQLYLFYDWNLGIVLGLTSPANGYCSFMQQTILNSLQKPEAVQTFQPRAVCDRAEAPDFTLRLLTGFVIMTLHKGPHNICFYDVVDANVLKLVALEIFELLIAGLQLLISKFRAPTAEVLQLQLLFWTL